MNETLKTLMERRSVRSYKPDQVPEDVLEQILKAGEYAPSGMGMQSAVMVVVQDAETIKKLSRINAAIMGSDSDPFYGAPTVVVVLADSKRGTCVEDGSLVLGNLMNAAFSLGVDSCWIHRARETFETEEGKELLKKWGLSEDYIGIGNCILGYSAGPLPEAKPRKDGYVIRVCRKGNFSEKEFFLPA
ncbi:MAG TPA: nitroreductase [Candidatus Eisenbergiella merdipullorum]|uniref:Nitroreductase n=1 Tax=Candidatus Eisenbergiella merdipullorum TaxID=2838553 RepID=A0A9D2I967_9FIRM|nr:nitroreductase [Candidatus Eisenbergiella merdipullorum]